MQDNLIEFSKTLPRGRNSGRMMTCEKQTPKITRAMLALWGLANQTSQPGYFSTPIFGTLHKTLSHLTTSTKFENKKNLGHLLIKGNDKTYLLFFKDYSALIGYEKKGHISFYPACLKMFQSTPSVILETKDTMGTWWGIDVLTQKNVLRLSKWKHNNEFEYFDEDKLMSPCENEHVILSLFRENICRFSSFLEKGWGSSSHPKKETERTTLSNGDMNSWPDFLPWQAIDQKTIDRTLRELENPLKWLLMDLDTDYFSISQNKGPLMGPYGTKATLYYKNKKTQETITYLLEDFLSIHDLNVEIKSDLNTLLKCEQGFSYTLGKSENIIKKKTNTTTVNYIIETPSSSHDKMMLLQKYGEIPKTDIW